RAAGGATIAAFSADNLSLNNPSLTFSDSFNAATNQQLSNSWLNQLGNIAVFGGKANGFGGLDIATVNGVFVPDSTVQADVVVAPGEYAGLVSRYSGPGDINMYWAGLNYSGGTVQAQIWRNFNGNWVVLTSESVASGGATLTFATSDNLLTLTVSGAPTLSVTDSSALSGPGMVGIRASAGATFDNFSATSP
ncbi:MAG TPA: hypothetical protein VKS79_06910, partial [Gemmataceae bacterium]|nr:hypothetical protein [Gemmataceae bacterium]